MRVFTTLSAGVHIAIGCRDKVSAAHYKRQTDRPRTALDDGNDIWVGCVAGVGASSFLVFFVYFFLFFSVTEAAVCRCTTGAHSKGVDGAIAFRRRSDAVVFPLTNVVYISLWQTFQWEASCDTWQALKSCWESSWRFPGLPRLLSPPFNTFRSQLSAFGVSHLDAFGVSASVPLAPWTHFPTPMVTP